MWFNVRAEGLDWVAPHREVLEIDVPMPPLEVWRRYIADPDAWPRWFDTMAGLRFLSDGGGQVGAVREVRLKDGMVVHEHFLAWDPGERFVFTIVGSNRPLINAMTESYVFTPTAEGCHFVYEVKYELPWWLRPFSGLVRRQFRPMFEAAMVALAATARADQAD